MWQSYETANSSSFLTLIQPNVGHLITSRGGPEMATNIYVRLINVWVSPVVSVMFQMEYIYVT